METVGSRIRLIRIQKGLTQKRFSNILGVSRPYISHIENDKRKPPTVLVKLISREFSITEQWLVSGSVK
ncbi:MAG: helix-turn-helix domain-containing protein [Clostridiales bacterium]|jgi:transcriptional regulator with XRE-family HTH domain|nr:helix-turn-helix domain-containing protein [Clostridiales bacterium]